MIFWVSHPKKYYSGTTQKGCNYFMFFGCCFFKLNLSAQTSGQLWSHTYTFRCKNWYIYFYFSTQYYYFGCFLFCFSFFLTFPHSSSCFAWIVLFRRFLHPLHPLHVYMWCATIFFGDGTWTVHQPRRHHMLEEDLPTLSRWAQSHFRKCLQGLVVQP